MPRADGPRFVHEFELAPSPAQARELGIRLDLARQMYNAFLGKALRRGKQLRRDPRWREAGQLKKAVASQVRQLRKAGKTAEANALCAPANALYAAVKHDVLLAERLQHEPSYTGAMSLHIKHPPSGIMTRLRQAHIKEHLDFKSCQAMATRAYATVGEILFASPVKHADGRPAYHKARFVKKGDAKALDSTSIHCRGESLVWNSTKNPEKSFQALKIPLRFDTEDRHGIQAHALAQMADPDNICESIRVLMRTIRGRVRYFTQVTLKGHAPWKAAQYVPGHGKIVGIDFGPSNIGIFSAAGGVKLELAEGLRHDYAKIRRLQRYLDRSRRAMNPENYHPNGTIKRTPGQRLLWHKSRRYLLAQHKLADLWRGYAAHRKNLLGQLANTIITYGTTIQIEQLSYKAWQKIWGKSIGRGAPGMLVALLRRKATQVGGELREFPTWDTKFSQLCHNCGAYTKKRLKLRVHRCDCGIGPIDRDIYSAFLAHHYDIASKTLNIGAARVAFAVLQYGAVDVEGSIKVRHAEPLLEPLSFIATDDQATPTVTRALAATQVPVGDHAGRRLPAIPTFQDSSSIAADIIIPGDARRQKPKQQRGKAIHTPPRDGPVHSSKKRRSQKPSQLTLF